MDQQNIGVCDTNVFISRLDVTAILPNHVYVTTPQVISEIKDSITREYVSNLPFEVKTNVPDKDAITAVSGFAKLTGDFQSLSEVDLKVMALAYMYIKQRGQHNFLRKKPMPLKNKKNAQINDAQESKESKQQKSLELFQPNPEEHPNDLEVKPQIEKEIQNQNEENEEPDRNESDDDGEGDWITPDNMEEKLHVKDAGLVEEQSQIGVCVITNDYAMQNVLLQMGIPLFSSTGKRIHKISTFVLRVAKTNDCEFCSACGNHMLEKVSLHVNSNGEVTYSNFRRNPKLRGTVYSIPKTKGGRKNQDLILREDQLVLGENRLIKKQIDKAKVSDTQWMESGFMKGIEKKKNLEFGYGKKNPNKAKKYYGKKHKI